MFPKENNARGLWVFLLACFSAFIAASYGDCGVPPRLDFATVQDQFIGQDHFLVGSIVSYKCLSGYIPIPRRNNTRTCLSDSTWSASETFCERRSCGNPGDTEHGEALYDSTLFGSRVYYTCHTGYNMISKLKYRECTADGTWSNEVPVCEVQSCIPPYPIADGSFDPIQEEYTYLQSVTYRCSDKKFALIGESSVFCNASGSWSSDAPKCLAVECPSPDVANAHKLSGFTGRYYFNNAVNFECVSGFTMKGVGLVKCNANNHWDPPLPTCSKNNVAAFMGNNMVILTMILMGHIIYHHF